jgi:CHAD domain-containing protein
MTYRLKLQEPIAQGVRRIALEQIEIAEAKLASKDDVAASVHDARRCLKRLRALLRLIRPALEEDLCRREAERLSGTGRLLSGVRDLDVMRQTLSKLESRFGEMPGGATERLRKLLADGQSLGRRSGAEGRRQALQRLGQTRKLFTGKVIAEVELGHLIAGLGRTYRKARKAFHDAYREPSDESFHAWRKQVQLHWRHMLLLSRGWPEALSARASEAKEVSQLLGEDHDHSILMTFAGEEAASAIKPEDLAAVTAVCRSCQTELRAAAKPRGERLFAESAGNLERRVTLYWTSAQKLAALAPAKDQPAADKLAPSQRVKSARCRKR